MFGQRVLERIGSFDNWHWCLGKYDINGKINSIKNAKPFYELSTFIALTHINSLDIKTKKHVISLEYWAKNFATNCPFLAILAEIPHQITSLTVVYSTVYSVTGLCAGNSPLTGESPHKWPATRKMFPFDDAIMFKVEVILPRGLSTRIPDSRKFLVWIPTSQYSTGISLPLEKWQQQIDNRMA